MLVPIFKQDYSTRLDTFSDPLTQAPVSANNVILFLLAIDIHAPQEERVDLDSVKTKLEFMKKEDIKPGLEVYLGAYSHPPPL